MIDLLTGRNPTISTPIPGHSRLYLQLKNITKPIASVQYLTIQTSPVDK